ncbi:MAG: hypothetical protein QM536_08920 [Chitinophagaceae bacterium]|nr:hypothetical protein [Chitinophagaceae bacterium]
MAIPIKKFKPATNIRDACENFIKIKELDESTKEFYVELYEELKRTLIHKLTLPAPDDLSILLSGQIETGKTSFLNFLLLEKEIQDKYVVTKIVIDNHVKITSENLNVYDVCFAVALELAAEIKRDFNNNALYDIIGSNLQNFYKDGDAQKKFSKDENMTVDLLQDVIKIIPNKIIEVALDHTVRTLFKHRFVNREREFENYFRDIVSKYKEIRLQYEPDKDILILIDELEKNVNPTSIKNVFGNMNILNKIPLKKIIVTPILATLIGVRLNNNVVALNVLSKNNPSETEKEKYKKNRELMKEIFYKRIDPSFQFLQSEDLLDIIIVNSGGNLGQFNKIIYESIIAASVRNPNAQHIIREDILKALNSIISPNALYLSFNGFPMSFLKELDQAKETFDKETFLKDASEKEIAKFNDHLLNNFFIVNNGQKSVYFINPILKPYIYGLDKWDIG